MHGMAVLLLVLLSLAPILLRPLSRLILVRPLASLGSSLSTGTGPPWCGATLFLVTTVSLGSSSPLTLSSVAAFTLVTLVSMIGLGSALPLLVLLVAWRLSSIVTYGLVRRPALVPSHLLSFATSFTALLVALFSPPLSTSFWLGFSLASSLSLAPLR